MLSLLSGKVGLSSFKNPFSKNNVAVIHINIYNEDVFHGQDCGGNIDFRATVQFKNGETTGEHAIRGAKSLQELVDKINILIQGM